MRELEDVAALMELSGGGYRPAWPADFSARQLGNAQVSLSRVRKRRHLTATRRGEKEQAASKRDEGVTSRVCAPTGVGTRIDARNRMSHLSTGGTQPSPKSGAQIGHRRP
jgi:hypothetical protein